MKNRSIFLIIFFITMSLGLIEICWAQQISANTLSDYQVCLNQLEQTILLRSEVLSESYKVTDPESNGLPSRNYGRLYKGVLGRGIVLQHGFSASPFELEDLAEYLNRMGYTVYLPILDGFGATAKVANQTNSIEWRKSFETSVLSFSRCHKEFLIGGLSLGGTLAFDFMLNSSVLDKDLQLPDGHHILGIITLAPYFEMYSQLAIWLNKVRFLISDQTLNVQTMYKITKNPDLLAFIQHPTHYLTAMPLDGAAQVMDLGSELIDGPQRREKIPIPLFFAVSVQDQTININRAIDMSEKHFAYKIKYLFLSSAEGIPHQISISNLNAEMNLLEEDLLQFINRIYSK